MKVTVANALLGSIFCCLFLSSSALGSSDCQEKKKSEIPERLSAKVLTYDRISTFPFNVNLVDRIIPLEDKKAIDILINRNSWLIFDPSINPNLTLPNLTLINNQNISLDSKPYTHQDNKGNVILGYQNTFWPSQNKEKYWGLTTVEHWGENNNQEITLPKQNYAEQAPTLPAGNSALTVSGGGNQNLVTDDESPGEFEEFRGGVAFHQGVSQNVTMGVGFVYEDLLVGFSQFTFEDDRFPLKTTISLLTGEQGLAFHSHVVFKPADNFVVNYYQEETNQKFDLNWGMIPGLNFIAKGNSEKESVTTGLKISINSNIFSLSAKAELDNNNQWQWNFNSTLGIFQLIHGSSDSKINSEVNLNLLEFESFGFQCSLFVKHQTRQEKENEESFVTWGGRLHSDEKPDGNNHRWALELGYGSGVHGNGAIASVSTVFQPNLLFKLTLEEISAVSDETNLKLELSSK